jgi:hypothetical protein
MLANNGMPTHSFQLIFDGRERTSIEAWEIMKRAAALQEAMMDMARRNNLRPSPLSSHHDAGYIRYPLPWHLPPHFAQTVRDIIQNKSTVRISGDTVDLWDDSMFYPDCLSWTMSEWKETWDQQVLTVGVYMGLRLPDKYDLSQRPISQTLKTVMKGRVIREESVLKGV